MRPYREEALSSALSELRQGTLSLRAAARKYNVPVTTLHDRKSGKVEVGAKWGKTALMPIAKEKELIHYALKRADLGIGFSKGNFLRFAGDFARSEGISFKNGVATEKWWRGLRKRHPDFSLRTPEPTSSGRHTSMNRLHVARYFAELKSVLTSNQLFDKPCLIWNMDETGLNLAPKRPKVIARKGSKIVHAKSSQSRELITVIACGNAAGEVIPPHVIVPGKTRRAIQSYDIENAPKGTMLSVSDSGWTKQGISELWFEQTFLPNIGSSRPQLLIMDGHDSHNHVELITKAREAGIIIMELPSKTSHFTQPFDRSVFKALKTGWSNEINTFTAKTGVTVGHSQFFRMLKPAWEKSMSVENISSGFIATGICPYNPGAIPDIAFAPSDLYSDECIASTSNSIKCPEIPKSATESGSEVVVSLDIENVHLNEILDLPVTVTDDGSLSVKPAEPASFTDGESFDPSSDSAPMPNETTVPMVTEPQIVPLPSTSSTAVTECTPEMALSVVESAITDDKRQKYESAFKNGITLNDSMYHTWLTYKKKVFPQNTLALIQPKQSQLLSFPTQLIKRGNCNKKTSFFVVTADEAYHEQVQAKLMKQKKEEEQAERKRQRILKRELKAKKSEGHQNN